jgi:hypothetical protein
MLPVFAVIEICVPMLVRFIKVCRKICLQKKEFQWLILKMREVENIRSGEI